MKQTNNINQLRSTQTDPVKNHSYTVIVPILDEAQSEWTVQVALDLARPRHGRVILVGVVVIPTGESLSTGAAQAQARRAKLEHLRSHFAGESVLVKGRIRVVHSLWRSMAKVVAQEQADLVMVPWLRQEDEPFFAPELDRLPGYLNCHVVIVSNEGPAKLRRILMPIRGSKEAPLTLEVALSLAQAAEGTVTMLYVTSDDQSLTSQQIYKELARMSQGNTWIKQELRVEGDARAAILAQACQHDLVVMGATETPPGSGQPAMGRIVHHLWQQQVGPLLVVKTYHPPPLGQLTSWRYTDPLPATPTSVVVDKWFAENTFNSQEFEDLERLVAFKEAQNLTISLGLPALNEEATVGNVIQTIQQALVKQFPLLDELVLIDSGSTDYTVEVARDLGIPIYQHADILPQYGSFQGKGEALWKSLHVLKGDLVVWIDTDIVNIHPRFVYGLIGPLLRHESIQYVKGFYRRPLKVGDTLQAGGGGRVTELVARPLINLFYPELSGIVQPLSGEYAGRRTALEQASFYVGYGVETGLLLDMVERYGITGIAQVDLRQRIHRNQSLAALSRMAFAIIQVFIDHLEQRQKVELLNEINRTMKIIRYETDSYYLKEHVISDQRRPPMITLPEYRASRGMTHWQAGLDAEPAPQEHTLV